jgi:hypothetical protein
MTDRGLFLGSSRFWSVLYNSLSGIFHFVIITHLALCYLHGLFRIDYDIP